MDDPLTCLLPAFFHLDCRTRHDTFARTAAVRR